jgi:hypothetical protein
MKKTFLGLLASFTAVFVSVFSLCPMDIWELPVFRPYARTSRVCRWMFNGRPPQPQVSHQN